MRHLGYLPLSLLLPFSTSACAATFERPVNRAELPSGRDAYVYGYFRIVDRMDQRKSRATVGLEIECGKHKLYRIAFSKRQPLVVLKVQPSECHFDAIMFTDDSGVKGRSDALPEELRVPTRYEAGHVYYIGNYSAERWLLSVGVMLKIQNVTHEYERTTADMRSAYPNLATLTAEDAMPGVLPHGAPLPAASNVPSSESALLPEVPRRTLTMPEFQPNAQ